VGARALPGGMPKETYGGIVGKVLRSTIIT